MMAALLVQIARRTAAQQIANRTAIAEAIRSFGASSSCNGKTKQQKTKPRGFRAATATTGKRIDSVAESLASKGFLRSRSAYEPPENVSGQVNGIFDSLKIPSTRGFALRTLEEKFTVLTACSAAFNHSVPNSQLYEIKTIDDIVEFYETPVDTTTPFEAMKRIELPENLHIQHEYLRFNPETDTRFGGKTAFPKSSTLVTGLKYRNKYPGHIAKRSWP